MRRCLGSNKVVRSNKILKMVGRESAMLIQGTIIVLMYIGLPTATQTSCSDTHYVLEAVGKCTPCRPCPAGSQPKIPCGSVIGLNDKIGECQGCPSGTYSSKKDTKSCQKCQSETCFKHQLIEGMCTSKNDASKCTNKCEDGYRMNVHVTKCEIDKPTTTKTPTSTKKTHTTKIPTTINNTTRKLVVLHSEKRKETGFHVGYIVLIVFIAAGAISVIIYKVVWPRLKMIGTNEPKGDEESNNSEVSHGSDANEEEAMKLGQEEESNQTGLPEQTAHHCTETTGGFADTAPNDSDHASHDVDATLVVQNPALSNIASERNKGFTDSTPPSRSDSVNFEMLVKLPVEMQQPTGMVNQQPLLVPNHFLQQPPPDYLSMNVSNNTRQQDLTRVGALPLGLYDEICTTFDTGPPGKDWKALAGWFGFTANQVKPFELEKHITDSMIRSWSTEIDNNIEKFISILIENRMTGLADKIEKACTDIFLV